MPVGLRSISGAPVVAVSGAPVQILDADGVTWRTLTAVPQRTNLVGNPTGAGSKDATHYDTWYTSYAAGTAVPTITTISITDGPLPGVTSAFRVQTVAGAKDVGASQRGYPAGVGMPVVAGDIVSGSIWVRPTSDDVTITLSFAWKADPAQASNGATYGPSTLCRVNVWTRVLVAGAVAPAGTTTAWLYVQARGTQAGAHDWQQTATLVEKSPTVDTFFDGSTSRSNAATNPSLKLNDDGWGHRWFGPSPATGSYSRVDPAAGGSPVAGGGYLRKTWTVAPTGNGDTGFDLIMRSNSTGTPAYYWTCTPGETITVSGFLRSSAAGKSFEVGVYWYPAGSTAIISRVRTPVRTKSIPGQWQRISGTFVAPAGAGCFYVVLDVATIFTGSGDTPWKAGETLDGTGLLIERAPTVGPYFEGTTNDDGDYRYLWSSTPNASTSLALP